MEESPFPFQGPLEPDDAVTRAELVADLTRRVSERRVTALLGPRRYGKTSALRRVAADVESAGATAVWVDLYEVASMSDLAVRLDDGLSATSGALRRRLDRIAATVSLHLGLIRVELNRPAAQRGDPLTTVHLLLKTLVDAALDSPTVVIFDEFSAITGVQGAAGLLRTYFQHHYRQIGLLFAGSEPSMMLMLFTDRAQPFYGQADLVEVEPLSAVEIIDIVNDGFARTGRDAGNLAPSIGAFSGGHPQRTMQLADAAWQLVPRGGTADAETWSRALDNARRETANGNERLYSGMTEGEKAVLRILAGNGSIFGTRAQLLDLANGTAQHARGRLTDRGHLHKVGERYRLVDPLFGDWIANRFPI